MKEYTKKNNLGFKQLRLVSGAGNGNGNEPKRLALGLLSNGGGLDPYRNDYTEPKIS